MVAIVVIGFFGGIFAIVENNNAAYLAVGKSCVEAGGSWVPNGNSGSYQCLRLQRL